MNDKLKIKAIMVAYLNLSLKSLLPIPFVIVLLSFFDIEQDIILTIAFLSSVIAVEMLLHFKKEDELESKSKEIKRSREYDLFFTKTDLFLYGAIAAKANHDDLMSSQELGQRASYIYEQYK